VKNWRDRAYMVIDQKARTQGEIHIDDILPSLIENPPHPNCWGPVWLRAQRAGIIERTGLTRLCLSDPGKHSHRYPVYRSLVA
jgi:hypothetical protein